MYYLPTRAHYSGKQQAKGHVQISWEDGQTGAAPGVLEQHHSTLSIQSTETNSFAPLYAKALMRWTTHKSNPEKLYWYSIFDYTI